MNNTSREELVDILIEPIVNPSGNWRDYNRDYKHRRNLYWMSLIQDSIIHEDELPEVPNVEDYPNIDNE